MINHRQHILVVDDEEPIRVVLSKYLRGAGYDVTSAMALKEALDLEHNSFFDLVILDIVMEDFNGFDLLDIFKREHPDLPVLIVTGLGFQEDVLTIALQKGADGYLSKGLPLDELLVEIHRILKRKVLPEVQESLSANAADVRSN